MFFFRKQRLLIFFFFVVSSFSFAQSLRTTDKNEFIVGEIKIFGNKTTKNYIILDEIPFSVGDTITFETLNYAKERIYSLRLFSFVDIVTDNKNPKRIIILVKESWYFFPIPFVVFRKNSIKYSNYGINILWKNFRGRNETISTVLSFGFDPTFTASYFNPNFRKRNVRFSLSGGVIGELNKSVTFEKKYSNEEFSTRSYFGTVGIGKRLSYKETVDFHIAFRNFNLKKSYAKYYFASRKNYENSLNLSLAYNYDSRNLSLNPTEGIYFLFTGGINFFTSNNNSSNNYSLLSAEVRKFFEYENLFIFRTKLKGRFIPHKNYLPYYDKYYFGYTNFVRGHSSEKSEGSNYFFISAEVAFPIISDKRIKLDLPYTPTSLTSIRLEMQIVFFLDAGKTFDTIKPWKIPYGFGTGIYLFYLPYDVLRLEVAFNEKLNWEILIGTGFPF